MEGTDQVIAVDAFCVGDWYPGFAPAAYRPPFAVDAMRRFDRTDGDRFWLLDFHWPRGFTPLGLVAGEDAFNWGAQVAAETLPLPAGRGITLRLAGTHPYASSIAVESPREVRARSARFRRAQAAFVPGFRSLWHERVAELDAAWDYLAGVDLGGLSRAGLATYLREARAFHRRALEIHFEVMYPLLAQHLEFGRVCADVGVEPDEAAALLHGEDTVVLRTDRALFRLAERARELGVAPLFAATPAEGLAAALATAGGTAAAWWSGFEDFLRVYGQRTEGSFDVALPSWAEDPTPALGTVKTLLRMARPHDVDAARTAATQAREATLDAVRTRLVPDRRAEFETALAAARTANFVWWQDEHNPVIDLRIALPMRWAARAVAAAVGAARPDDTVFLFWSELLAVADGTVPYGRLCGLVEERRQYFEYWRDRRPAMPRVLGRLADAVRDPILVEVFGLSRKFLDAAGAAGTPVGPTPDVFTLEGMAVARGVGRGPARVLTDADRLHEVVPGEVLVCESTSPNWTPAFAKLAGCVCDGGGMLSHAAIVGREYGVPTVTACGRATELIRDGDDVEVDGGSGTVTVRRRVNS